MVKVYECQVLSVRRNDVSLIPPTEGQTATAPTHREGEITSSGPAGSHTTAESGETIISLADDNTSDHNNGNTKENNSNWGYQSIDDLSREQQGTGQQPITTQFTLTLFRLSNAAEFEMPLDPAWEKKVLGFHRKIGAAVTIRETNDKESGFMTREIVAARPYDKDIEAEYIIPNEEGQHHPTWARNLFTCFCIPYATEAAFLTKKRLIHKIQWKGLCNKISFIEDTRLEDIKRISSVGALGHFGDFCQAIAFLILSLLVIMFSPTSGLRGFGFFLLLVAIVYAVVVWFHTTEFTTLLIVLKEPGGRIKVTLNREDAYMLKCYLYYTIGSDDHIKSFDLPADQTSDWDTFKEQFKGRSLSELVGPKWETVKRVMHPKLKRLGHHIKHSNALSSLKHSAREVPGHLHRAGTFVSNSFRHITIRRAKSPVSVHRASVHHDTDESQRLINPHLRASFGATSDHLSASISTDHHGETTIQITTSEHHEEHNPSGYQIIADHDEHHQQ